MISMALNTRFKIGDSAFVMDKAEFVVNNSLVRIPLGTPVRVRTVSVLQTKGYAPEIRYEVQIASLSAVGLTVWIDDSVLTPRVLEVV